MATKVEFISASGIGSQYISPRVQLPPLEEPLFVDADGVKQYRSADCRPLHSHEEPTSRGKRRQEERSRLRFGPDYIRALALETSIHSKAAVDFWMQNRNKDISIWLCPCYDPEPEGNSLVCQECGFSTFYCSGCDTYYLTQEERGMCRRACNERRPISLPRAWKQPDIDYCEPFQCAPTVDTFDVSVPPSPPVLSVEEIFSNSNVCHQLGADFVYSEWKPVKRAKRAVVLPQFEIPLRNTFSGLEIEELDVDQEECECETSHSFPRLSDFEKFCIANRPRNITLPRLLTRRWVDKYMSSESAFSAINVWADRIFGTPVTESRTIRRNNSKNLMRKHMKVCGSGHKWDYCHLNPEAVCWAVCSACSFHVPSALPVTEGISDWLPSLKIGPDPATGERIDKLVKILEEFSKSSNDNVDKVLEVLKNASSTADENVKSAIETFSKVTRELTETAKYVSDNGLKINFASGKNSKDSVVSNLYQYGPALINLCILCFVDLKVSTKVCLAIPSIQMLLSGINFSSLVSKLTKFFSGGSDDDDDEFNDADDVCLDGCPDVPDDIPKSEGPYLFDNTGISSFMKIGALVCGLSFSTQDYLFQSMIDGFLRRTALLQRTAGFGSSILEKIKIAFQVFVNWMYAKLGYEPVFLDEYSKFLKPFFDLSDKLLATKVDYSTVDELWVEKVFETYRIGLDVSRKMTDFRCPSTVLQALNTRLVGLSRICNKCEALASISKPRSPPLFVYLHGSSGVGKSTVVNSLQVDIAKVDPEMDPEKWCANIYLRQPEDEFHSGATNGKYVEFFDEFGQFHDSATTRDPSYMEILRLGNVIPFPRKMADLSDKGKIFARPRLVFATSNLALDELAIKSIKCVDAFKRRWDIVAEVTIDPNLVPGINSVDSVEKAKALGKYQLAYKERTGKPIDLNVYRFSFQHEGIQKACSYSEFITIVASEYKKRRVQSDGYVDYLSQYAKEPFPGTLPSSESGKSIHIRDLIKKYSNSKVLPQMADFKEVIDKDNKKQIFELSTDNWCNELYHLLLYRHFGTINSTQASRLKEVYGFEKPKVSDDHQYRSVFRLLYFLYHGGSLPDTFTQTEKSILKDLVGFKTSFALSPVTAFFFPLRGLLCELNAAKALVEYLPKNPSLAIKIREWSGSSASSLSGPAWLVYLKGHGLNLKLMSLKSGCSASFSLLLDKWEERGATEAAWGLCCDQDGYTRSVFDDDFLKLELGFYQLSDAWFVPELKAPQGSTWSRLFRKTCANGWGLASKIPAGARTLVALALAFSGGFFVFQAISGLVALASSFLTKQAEDVIDDLMPVSQSLTRGGVGNKRVVVESLSQRSVGNKRPVSEGLTDNNSMAYSIKVSKNMRTIKTRCGDAVAEMSGVIVKGRCFLTYRHSFEHFARVAAQSGLIDVYDANQNFIVSFPHTLLRFVFDKFEKTGQYADRMMLEFPRVVPAGSDISHSFISLDQIEKVNGDRVALVVPARHSGKMPHFPVVSVQKSICRFVKNDVYYNESLSDVSHSDLFQYECETSFGDCGSVLVSFNNSLPSHKICGIHVASIQNARGRIEYPDAAPDGRVIFNGRSAVVCREHIESMMSKLSSDAQLFSLNLSDPRLDVDEEMPVSENFPIEGNFHELGEVKTPVATKWSSKLIQSPVTGILAPTVVCPAHLSPVLVNDTLVNPLFKSLSKAGNAPPVLNYNHLSQAAKVVSHMVIESSEVRPFLLNDEQVVNGLPGTGLLSSFTTSTSPGYPYCKLKEKGKGGKKTWIDHEKSFVSPDFINEVNQVYDLATQGIRSSVVWQDFAKDETRPIEKVKELKTRSVNCSPVVFTAVCRKVFGAFCASVVDGKIKNGIAIGVNPYGFEWTDVAFHLLEVGNLMIAGDFGNWDGGLTAELMWSAYDVIEEFYDLEELEPEEKEKRKRARRTIFEDIVNSVHIAGKLLYQWSHSMPSGTYLTAFLNSIMNLLLFISYLLSKGVPILEIRSSFRAIVLGDDHIYSISRRLAITYGISQDDFRVFVEKIGMKYTDESKSNRVHVFRPLAEVSFLKRTFVWLNDSQRFIGPLAYESVCEMLNWIRTNLPVRVALKLNVTCVVWELSLHGEEVFNRCVTKIKREFRRKNLPYDVIMPYECVFSQVTSGAVLPFFDFAPNSEWNREEDNHSSSSSAEST